MLSPKKYKFIKQHRILLNNNIKIKKNKIVFGIYGFQSKKNTYITSKQIKTIKNSILLNSKKGKIWFRIFPNNPVTSKLKGMRMGSGKGYLKLWIANIKLNQIIFETNNYILIKNIKITISKLPIPIKIKYKFDYENKNIIT
uniref:Ribosomal protein L16 n=1 Tax=Rhopalocnemis phalloides TaxID=1128106 RepID=A0A8K1XLR7_9MAGN|nr:ribosomal protein L16 [Rhopalocnemis phalloides]